jgi:1-deoxy-D-xylulose-5-phosphate reductoisomerase
MAGPPRGRDDPAARSGEGPRLRVVVLGSTGSIGRQTLDVLASDPVRYEVVALAAGRDAATLGQQARSLRPRCVTLGDAGAAAGLDLPPGTRLLEADEPLTRLALLDDVDLVVVATGGVVSLRPVLAALGAGRVVATANKETLVTGGHLVMPLARALAERAAVTQPASPLASPLAWLRPIDSEHSAIWQCLAGEDPAAVARLVLTASGGPFRTWPARDLADARPEDALAHPTWDMGAKITIDSATLMNKGLEVIEAHWLYDVPYDAIEVVIHPQSIVHSLVEFVDHSVKAQLGLPDMRIPIQHAVSYPARRPGRAPRLDLVEQQVMTFEAPDHDRFPALRVAREAARVGPSATAALVPADDVAVARFLNGSLPFTGIVALVEAAVERFGDGPAAPSEEELEAVDAEVRAWARAWSYGAPPSGGSPA